MTLRLSLFGALVSLIAFGTGRAARVEEAEPGQFLSEEMTIELPVSGEPRFLIRSAQSLQGELRIEVDSSPRMRFVYRLEAHTKSKGAALQFIDAISISKSQVGDEVRLEFRAPNPAPWDSRTESAGLRGTLVIPQRSRVEVHAGYFHLVAVGPLSELLVPASLGRQTISNVHGRVEIATNNQRIDLRDVSGQIRATTSNATIRAERVQALTESASLRNDGGDIIVSDIEGGLNIRNRFGKIEIDRFTPSGSSFIRGNAGMITIRIMQLVSGQLVVDNELDDIELVLPRNPSVYLALAVDDDGAIDVAGFPFIPDLVQRNRLNLTIGTGEIAISASVDGKGTISVRSMEGQ